MNSRLRKLILLAGAAALAAPAATYAQDARDLDQQRSDVRIYSGEVTDGPALFTFTMQAGESLQIDAIPTGDSGLDPVMTVSDADSGEVLGEDDDGGDGLASRVRIHSEEARRIEISVGAYSYFGEGEGGGAFELQLRPSDFRPTPPRTASFDSEVHGSLEAHDSHLFQIAVEGGQMLEVALTADNDDLDPMLELYRGTLAIGEPAASNDDGGEGLNSLLRYIAPESGTYSIRALPFGDTSGDYTLRIAPASFPELQSPEQAIGLGETLTGRLGEGYEQGSIDPSVITYQFTAGAIESIRAGASEVTINMMQPQAEDGDFPSGVDPLLELGFETPIGWASLQRNDDGGEGLNARIAVDLGPVANEPGWLERLRIKATSYGGTGEYAIEVVEGLQPVEQGWEGFPFGE